FSSRRRHTSFSRDWSSDVCSSDLFDVCYSSNVLEHVPDPWRMAEEMLRVTRPDGVVFLSYTVWFGPWGGHETAPWHFLGGRHARDRKSAGKVTGEAHALLVLMSMC